MGWTACLAILLAGMLLTPADAAGSRETKRKLCLKICKKRAPAPRALPNCMTRCMTNPDVGKKKKKTYFELRGGVLVTTG